MRRRRPANCDLRRAGDLCDQITLNSGVVETESGVRQLHPVVEPHVSHLRQVPFLTSVKLPHSPQASPS